MVAWEPGPGVVPLTLCSRYTTPMAIGSSIPAHPDNDVDPYLSKTQAPCKPKPQATPEQRLPCFYFSWHSDWTSASQALGGPTSLADDPVAPELPDVDM